MPKTLYYYGAFCGWNGLGMVQISTLSGPISEIQQLNFISEINILSHVENSRSTVYTYREREKQEKKQDERKTKQKILCVCQKKRRVKKYYKEYTHTFMCYAGPFSKFIWCY